MPTDDELRERAKAFVAELEKPQSQPSRRQLQSEFGCEQFATPGDPNSITRVYYQPDGSFIKLVKTRDNWTEFDNKGARG